MSGIVYNVAVSALVVIELAVVAQLMGWVEGGGIANSQSYSVVRERTEDQNPNKRVLRLLYSWLALTKFVFCGVVFSTTFVEQGAVTRIVTSGVVCLLPLLLWHTTMLPALLDLESRLEVTAGSSTHVRFLVWALFVVFGGVTALEASFLFTS